MIDLEVFIFFLLLKTKNCLTVSLRKYIKILQNELEKTKNELESVKNKVKYTKIEELEVFMIWFCIMFILA